MNEAEDKKWNEWPFSFPPVNTLALVEFDTARNEWYRGFIICHGMDECGCYCRFQWLEGPKINQTVCYYTPESFKPLIPIENKEEEDAPKQEKSLDNLLKEFHNLKQEQKELSDKIAGVVKDINQMLDSCGLAVVYKYEL